MHLLSYDEHVKGYHCFNLPKKQVLISGNVCILETTEPIAPAESEPTEPQIFHKGPSLEIPPLHSINNHVPLEASSQPSCGEHSEPVLTIPASPQEAVAHTTIPSGSPDFPSAVVSPMLSSPPQLLVSQGRAPSQLAPEPLDNLRRSQRQHTFNVKLSDFVASAEIFTSLMEGSENHLFWKAVQH